MVAFVGEWRAVRSIGGTIDYEEYGLYIYEDDEAKC